MNDHPSEELLSAYLDGELTGDEQASVERWLAQSDEARLLLDEFRGLRGDLQALPRFELGPRFAEGVLRAAEREVLLGPAEAAAESAAPRSASTNDRPSPNWAEPKRTTHWRMIAWPAVAMAAAMLLMVFGPGGFDWSNGDSDEKVATHEGSESGEPGESQIGPAPSPSNRDPAGRGSPAPGVATNEEGNRPRTSPGAFVSKGGPTSSIVGADPITGTGEAGEQTGPLTANPALPTVDVSRIRGQRLEPSAPILVVVAEITPEAFERQALESIYQANEIAIVAGAPTRAAGQSARADGAAIDVWYEVAFVVTAHPDRIEAVSAAIEADLVSFPAVYVKTIAGGELADFAAQEPDHPAILPVDREAAVKAHAESQKSQASSPNEEPPAPGVAWRLPRDTTPAELMECALAPLTGEFSGAETAPSELAPNPPDGFVTLRDSQPGRAVFLLRVAGAVPAAP